MNESTARQFEPISLKKIQKPAPGTFLAEIVSARHHHVEGDQVLTVGFRVCEGPHTGLFLSKSFFPGANNLKTTARRDGLSYLCDSVGIKDKQLKSPDDLVARRVKIVVVLNKKKSETKGRQWFEIVRFYKPTSE